MFLLSPLTRWSASHAPSFAAFVVTMRVIMRINMGRRARRRAAVIASGTPGDAHAFENALKLGKIRRVVAPRRPGGAGAGDREGRVEREAGPDGGMRLVQSTEVRESSGQIEI